MPFRSNRSDNPLRLENKYHNHEPRHEREENEPEAPAHARALRLLALLLFEPGFPVVRVSGDARPELEARGRAAG